MRELIVDSFAGGGGASTGIHMALGISPDIAINHDATALAMHRVNHPETVHVPSNIWKVSPSDVCGGRKVGLLWASPDCKHFSKAKGGKPVEKNIRDLAWVIIRWCREVDIRMVMMENVEEITTWGPLGPHNRPCPDRKGSEFKRWLKELKGLGYKVEHRELRACDYGAPTIRKRLFLIARKDGLPIVWPEPTHGAPASDGVKSGNLKPWRTAAEIIDWHLPCHSIFLTTAEAKEVGVKRPLADATMARIAKGVKRYVLDAKEPFIVNLTHQGGDRAEAVTDPMMTVTGAHRGEKAVVAPVLARAQHGGGVRPVDEPAHTITASRKDQNQIIAPNLVRTDMTSAFRRNGVMDAEAPLNTQMTAQSFAVVQSNLAAGPFVTGVGGRMGQTEPRDAQKPAQTLTAKADSVVIVPHVMTNRNAQKPHNEANKPTHVITAGGAHLNLVAATMIKQNFGDKPASGADEPLHTVTTQGNRHHLAAAFLAKHYGDTGQRPGSEMGEPVSTVTASDHNALVSAGLLNMRGTADDQLMPRPIDGPAATASAQGGHQGPIVATLTPDGEHTQARAQMVAAFMQKYYGTDQNPQLGEPLHTATTKDRFGLVTVTINGEPYFIADIGMRMLTPRELFRAQGFPNDYIIDRGKRADAAIRDGNLTDPTITLTKTDQVRMCGNSVCPQMAEALVRANFRPLEVEDPEQPDFRLEAAE